MGGSCAGLQRRRLRRGGKQDGGCGGELRSSLAAQDAGGDDRSRTITANWDPVSDAASYTLRWQRIGVNLPEQEQAQRDGTLRQARSALAGIAQQANAQPENRITVPASQTSAEFTLPRRWRISGGAAGTRRRQ